MKKYYRDILADLLPHRLIMICIRVIFNPKSVINMINDKNTNPNVTPAAFIITVVGIVLIFIQIILPKETESYWLRSVFGLEQQWLDRFKTCFFY